MDWKTREFWIVIILLLATGIYVNILRYTRVAVTEEVDLTQLPADFGDWRLEETISLGKATEEILKSDQNVWRKYINSRGRSVGFFVAYFKDQKYGAQIHSPIHCVPGGGWKIIDRGTYRLDVRNPEARLFKINKMINSNGKYNEIMLYWYCTRSGIITSEYQLKFDLAKNALFRKPTDAALIRINLLIAENDLSETLQSASQFIEAMLPSLQHILPFKK